MRQRWSDSRLAYDHLGMNISQLSLDHRMYHSIWVPDLFFPNEKSSHVHCVTVPNSMIRIYPDGRILYSARYVDDILLLCDEGHLSTYINLLV